MPRPGADVDAVKRLPFVRDASFSESIFYVTIAADASDTPVRYSVCIISEDDYPRSEASVFEPFSAMLPRTGNLSDLAKQVLDVHNEKRNAKPKKTAAPPKTIIEVEVSKYSVAVPGGTAELTLSASEGSGDWATISIPIAGILDSATASAWSMDASQPITMRLRFGGQDFFNLNRPPEPTEIKQGGSTFPVGYQLIRILKQAFQAWWTTGTFLAPRLNDGTFSSASSSSAKAAAPARREFTIKPSDLDTEQRARYQSLTAMGFHSDRALLSAYFLSTVGEAVDTDEHQLIEMRERWCGGAAVAGSVTPPPPPSGPVDPEAVNNPFAKADQDETRVYKLPPPYEEATGFFTFVVRYVLKRLSTLNRFCVICDEPHLFSAGMKPCVCVRNVCAFAFQELHVGEDAASGMATDAGVIDLLVNIFKAACKSSRASAVLNPFPHVFHPVTRQPVLDPAKPDLTKAQQLATLFPPIAEVLGSTSMASLRQRLDERDVIAFPLLQWLINSNRSHIVKMDPLAHLKQMGTAHQFLLLMSAPEKQRRFEQLKAQSKSNPPTKFMFHGSPTENWHAIMRNGLRVMSGTTGQINGAAHGRGVYFAPQAGTSIDYCRPSFDGSAAAAASVHGQATAHYIPEKGGYICLALCEIVADHIKDHGWCSTVEEEDAITTRFLFVYDSTNYQAARSVDGNAITAEAKRSMAYYHLK